MGLVFDVKKIGERIYKARKNCDLTQAQVAEAAELSDRAYADIERGSVNMRILSMLKICSVLKLDPNSLLTDNGDSDDCFDSFYIINALNNCSEAERRTALRLIAVYIESLKH